MQSEFLTQGEVCLMLRISRPMLAKWRDNGVGPSWVNLDGKIRYMRTELAIWLSRQVTGGEKELIEAAEEFREWLMERLVYGPPPLSAERVAELLAEMNRINEIDRIKKNNAPSKETAS